MTWFWAVLASPVILCPVFFFQNIHSESLSFVGEKKKKREDETAAVATVMVSLTHSLLESGSRD